MQTSLIKSEARRKPGNAELRNAETLCQSQNHVNSLGFYVASIDNAVGLSGNEFRVLVHLRHRQGKNAYAWPCIRTIAERCEMHPETAQIIMNRLEKLGAITISRGTKTTKGKPGQTSLYTVHSPEKWAKGACGFSEKERAENPHIIRTMNQHTKKERDIVTRYKESGQQTNTACFLSSETEKESSVTDKQSAITVNSDNALSPEETRLALVKAGVIDAAKKMAAGWRAESAQTRLEPAPEPIDYESLERC